VTRNLTAEFAAVSVPCRVSAPVLGTEPAISVIGVYVPSRDCSANKTERKQRFIRTLVKACDELPADLREHLVLGGNYNVIGTTHRPESGVPGLRVCAISAPSRTASAMGGAARS
jgi:exodeoxyribonuclease III